MLDGGPALWYLNRLRHDGSNAILSQGINEGSGGRRLLETEDYQYSNQTRIPQVDKFELSNHAITRHYAISLENANPLMLYFSRQMKVQRRPSKQSLQSKPVLPSNSQTLELLN